MPHAAVAKFGRNYKVVHLWRSAGDVLVGISVLLAVFHHFVETGDPVSIERFGKDGGISTESFAADFREIGGIVADERLGEARRLARWGATGEFGDVRVRERLMEWSVKPGVLLLDCGFVRFNQHHLTGSLGVKVPGCCSAISLAVLVTECR